VALTEVDRNLLKRCLSQTPGAWQDFVDRFVGLFIHVIQHSAHLRTVPLTADDVDDLCSEIFLTLLKDDFAVLRHFRGESALATYLTVIARRVVVRELVQRRKAEAMGHVNAHFAALPKSDDSDIHRVEKAEEVSRMLSGLPERDAAIVRQFHLEGRSYREISQRLGVPENTIGPTLSRARERLRRERIRTGA
jgi:RNA polymerase sigma-70 factor (ECF subfamily)